MKFTAAATAFFAGLVAASPAVVKEARTEYVKLTYWAAAGNTVDVYAPADGTKTYIYSDLSFTSISSSSSANTVCHAHGVDNSDTVLYGSQANVPIGPPQRQTYVTCTYNGY